MNQGAGLLCVRQESVLMVVDMQERLLAAMPEPERDNALRFSATLVRAAQALDIPVVSTTQYQRGLGSVHASLAPLLPAPAFDKTSFSCAGAPDVMAHLSALRRSQVILCGVETHVCVLQTALELQARGKTVFVVEDAVASRSRDNRRNALRRLARSGVVISNTESVVFEWLRDARHDAFKELSALIR